MKPIIQELIAISGWAALNAMVFIVTAATGSDREARSFDDDPAKSPKLTVAFTSPTAPSTSQDVVTLVKGQKAKLVTVTFV